jgi:bla regulator protein blaR1
MIATLLSTFRNAGLPIANHLWQSTMFVAAIGLLALLFGRNRARVRYGLWLAASAKFLIPFSALMALGTAIPASNHAFPVLQPSLVFAVQAVDQPFSAGRVTQPRNAQSFLQGIEARLPAALALIWVLGFAAVLLAWYARWRHVSKVLQRAIPVEDGREIDILCHIENHAKAPPRTQFLISSDLMEPGVFGIFRPVLLWPARLSDRLEDTHIEAILAHEVAHVHRRDNLTALIHMLVEAIFWFHPFVWWIERKMLEERERACDEAVIQAGSRAEIYADSLLKVSRFCAELPLPCVSGITGADLSKRIRSIMASRLTDLGLGKRLLLAVLATSVVVGPVACGLMHKPPLTGQIPRPTGPLPSFEVASIRPNHSGSHLTTNSIGLLNGPVGPAVPKDRYIVTNTTIKELICWAWAGNSLPWSGGRVSGGPGWIDSERYDIDAKLEDSQVAALEKLPPQEGIMQIKLMVQSLLADRLGLTVKNTTLTVPVYALVVAKGGPKLQETVPGSPSPIEIQGHPVTVLARAGEVRGHAIPVSTLAQWISQNELGRPVVDRTGLKGKYDVDLKWTPDFNGSRMPPGPPGMMPGPSSGTGTAPPPDTSSPSIFTAIQEQLGLKLEPSTGAEDAIVIAHIEKPSQN